MTKIVALIVLGTILMVNGIAGFVQIYSLELSTQLENKKQEVVELTEKVETQRRALTKAKYDIAQAHKYAVSQKTLCKVRNKE